MCLHDEKNKLLKDVIIINFRKYGGRGGRDWPYHLDPSLARDKEISGAGDDLDFDLDTDAFGE